jgi:Tfp pilus assembly protein FimT
MLKNIKGFTSKELIVVLIIISALCLMSIPAFYHLQEDAHLKRVEKTVDRLEKALSKQQDKPVSLDNSPDKKFCQDCFHNVFRIGLTDKGWFKVSSHEYLYSPSGTMKYDEAIKHPHQFRVYYNQQTGNVSFVEKNNI